MVTVPVASWGSDFFGVERAEGIRRVVSTGADCRLDGLSFEQSSQSPVLEPGSAMLVGLRLGALGLQRRSAR